MLASGMPSMSEIYKVELNEFIKVPQIEQIKQIIMEFKNYKVEGDTITLTKKELSEAAKELRVKGGWYIPKEPGEVTWAELTYIGMAQALDEIVQIIRREGKRPKMQPQQYTFERTVHTYANGHPYVDELELYDDENDVPLAKKGDIIKFTLEKIITD